MSYFNPIDRNAFLQQSQDMKTIIELPEQLLTEVKRLAAREQRELVRAGIESRPHPVDSAQLQANTEQWVLDWIKSGEEMLRNAPPGPTATEILAADQNRLEQSAEQWLAGWFKLADDLMKDAPIGPTAREILEEDRNRLERR
jgi:hypothetical protein